MLRLAVGQTYAGEGLNGRSFSTLFASVDSVRRPLGLLAQTEKSISGWFHLPFW